LKVRACSRDGRVHHDFLSDDRYKLHAAAGDVTSYDSISEAIEGASAVIFAASASRKRSHLFKHTAKMVDFLGLANTARACLAHKVPRLVVVSCGGVSQPDSNVYQFFNIFGGIMEYKFRGEEAVR